MSGGESQPWLKHYSTVITVHLLPANFPLAAAARVSCCRSQQLHQTSPAAESPHDQAERTGAAHLFCNTSVLHRGTLLNVIQTRTNIFPAYLKSLGAASRTTGADSPLSFVGAIVGAYVLGLGV